MVQIIEKMSRERERDSHCQLARISLYLQYQVAPKHIKHNYEVVENFVQHTCFRVERGQEKSACRVSFILTLHVKIAVIQSIRRAIMAVLH